VHKDITFHHPRCPFYFIANIVLDDFSPANGSTGKFQSSIGTEWITLTPVCAEFWLGSHAHTTSADQVPCTEETKVRQQVPGDPSCNVKPSIVEQRRPIRPPIQAECSKGDIMIRDLRTWHAGMPNDSSKDRLMIAIGYQVCFALQAVDCADLNTGSMVSSAQAKAVHPSRTRQLLHGTWWAAGRGTRKLLER
jgi:hypothetical protein